MNKAVMISIRPEWCEKICGGEKTIEVRKTRPKLETPFKCYIYCTVGRAGYDALWVLDAQTREKYSFLAVSAYLENPKGANKGDGKVIGEFVCDCVTPLYNVCMDDWKRLAGGLHNIEKELVNQACLTEAKLHTYAGGKNCFAWHISELKIYDAPKELSEFSPMCMYKNDDKSCQSRMIACSYQKYDYNPDGSINLVECGRTLERPPQSWCYVEEVE